MPTELTFNITANNLSNHPSLLDCILHYKPVSLQKEILKWWDLRHLLKATQLSGFNNYVQH